MSRDERSMHGAQLSDKILERSESQADTGFCWERSRVLHLRGDLTFHFVDRRSSSVSGGGLSMPSSNEDVLEGRWTVEMRGFSTYLVLKQDGVEITSWRSENRGPNLHFLDGEAWERYTPE
jgi:hypothetical protein